MRNYIQSQSNQQHGDIDASAECRIRMRMKLLEINSQSLYTFSMNAWYIFIIK